MRADGKGANSTTGTWSESGASRLISRRLLVGGATVEVRIEAALWEAMDDIAARRGLDRAELAAHAVLAAPPGIGADSALRLFVLDHYRKATGE